MLLEGFLASIHLLVAFLGTILLTSWWIKVARRNKLGGKDMNKYNKPFVPEAGGVAVIATVVIALLLYMFFKTFILSSQANLLEISTLIITLLLACFIGFIDDILGWKKGLKQWQKFVMTLPIAIPLAVINAGNSLIDIPILGMVDLGVFFPLILVPIGVWGATNGYNILAGYNGLEAGLGAIIIGTLSAIALITGKLWLALIGGIVVVSLISFYLFNKYPSRVFPGDSLTYSLGALIASFAILGDMEKIALFLFIPFIIEGLLKLRSRLKAENFGIPNKDGSLEPPYDKNYSLTHVSLRLLKKIKPSGKVYEKDVTYLLLIFQILLSIVTIIFLI